MSAALLAVAALAIFPACRSLGPGAGGNTAEAGAGAEAGAATPPHEDPSRWVRAGGAVIHYYDTGPAGAPRALLLVHGWSSAASPFLPLIRNLPLEVRVVAPDLPGHGLSEAPDVPYSLDYYLDFLEELARALGLERFALAGSSMGTILATHYALRRPEQVISVIMLSPVGLRGQLGPFAPLLVSPLLVGAVAAEVTELSVRRLLSEGVCGQTELLSPEIVSTYAGSFANRARRRAFSRTTSALIGRTFLDTVLPQLPQPVLIVAGENDCLLSPEQLARYRQLLPAAQVHVLRGACHMLHLQQPAEAAHLVGDFVASRDLSFSWAPPAAATR